MIAQITGPLCGGVLAFVVIQHSMYQFKKLTHLTWFLGSGLVSDIKAKTKTSTPYSSPGPEVRTTTSLPALFYPLYSLLTNRKTNKRNKRLFLVKNKMNTTAN